MVYGLQFTVYHSWRTRTVYYNVDGPTQNLSTKQFCIVVCALALYGMLPVVLYDGLRYTCMTLYRDKITWHITCTFLVLLIAIS